MSNKVAPSPVYDILQQLKTEIFKDLRACLPANISGINLDGTVNAIPSVMQNIAQKGLPSGLDFTYPELLSCPVVTIQGGGVGFVPPVAAGDKCLLVFSDRAINTWFTTGQPNPLPSMRMHDISDGFALVGLNSLRNPLVTSLAVLGEGGLCETKASAPTIGAKVAINPATHKISISNGVAGANSLLLILTTVFTALAADPGLDGASHAALAAANAALATLLY